MNLNEVERFSDPIDVWAAEREFELRKIRYERWINGGVVGVMKRMTEGMEAFATLLGTHAET